MQDSVPMCKLTSELKNLAAIVFNSVTQEMTNLRNYTENQNKIFEEEIKGLKVDTAERDNLVSRFCEKKIEELRGLCDERYKTSKGLTAVLAAEMKKHINNYLENNAMVEDKFINFAKTFDRLTVDLVENWNDNLKRNMELNLQRLNTFEGTLKTMGEAFVNRYVELSKYVKDIFDGMQDQFGKRFNIVDEKFNAQSKVMSNFQGAVNEQLAELHEHKSTIVEALGELNEELETNWQEVYQKIGFNESMFNVNLNNEAAIRESSFKALADGMTILRDGFDQTTGDVNNAVKRLTEFCTGSIEKLEGALANKMKTQDAIFKEIQGNWDKFKIQINNFMEQKEELTTNISNMEDKFDHTSKSMTLQTQVLQSYFRMLFMSNHKKTTNLDAECKEFVASFKNELEELRSQNRSTDRQVESLSHRFEVEEAKKLEDKYEKMVDTFKSENNKLRLEFVNLFKSKVEDFDAFVDKNFTQLAEMKEQNN